MKSWTAATGFPLPGAPAAGAPAAGTPAAGKQPAGKTPAGAPLMPATMSARQMETVLTDLAARRAQVQALVAQLQAFDDQLGSLEGNLRPLLEWTRTWAGMESAMGDFWRPLSGGAGT